jgi:hypothetical protein
MVTAERGRKLWLSGSVFLAKGRGVGFGLFLAKGRETAALPGRWFWFVFGQGKGDGGTALVEIDVGFFL